MQQVNIIHAIVVAEFIICSVDVMGDSVVLWHLRWFTINLPHCQFAPVTNSPDLNGRCYSYGPVRRQ